MIGTTKVYYCPVCKSYWPLDCDKVALHECSTCLALFSTRDYIDGTYRHCPECGKVTYKVSGNGCPGCKEAELEDVQGYQCDVCNDCFGTIESWHKHMNDLHPGAWKAEEENSEDPNHILAYRSDEFGYGGSSELFNSNKCCVLGETLANAIHSLHMQGIAFDNLSIHVTLEHIDNYHYNINISTAQ